MFALTCEALLAVQDLGLQQRLLLELGQEVVVAIRSHKRPEEALKTTKLLKGLGIAKVYVYTTDVAMILIVLFFELLLLRNGSKMGLITMGA